MLRCIFCGFVEDHAPRKHHSRRYYELSFVERPKPCIPKNAVDSGAGWRSHQPSADLEPGAYTRSVPERKTRWIKGDLAMNLNFILFLILALVAVVTAVLMLLNRNAVYAALF